MTTDGNGGEAPAERRPRIVIEFVGPDRAECQITPDPDVTTGQLFGAAWLLEAWAREVRQGYVATMAAQQRGLVIPGAGVRPVAVRRQ